MFICTVCGTEKPADQFYVWRGKRFKQCRKCRNRRTEARIRAQDKWNDANRVRYMRERRVKVGRAYEREMTLRSTYGITTAQFDAMLVAQSGRCAICRVDHAGQPTRFCVDHDHRCCPGSRSCGKCIRGLLCRKCNVGIAQLGDAGREAEEALASALAYVSRGPYAGGTSEGLLY